MNDIFLSLVAYLWRIGIKSNLEVLAVVLVPGLAVLGLVYFVCLHVEELGLADFWEQEQQLLAGRLEQYNNLCGQKRRAAKIEALEREAAAWRREQGGAPAAGYTQEELVKDVVGYLRSEPQERREHGG